MSVGTDYSKLLFHDTICNYIVECEYSNYSPGVDYIGELEKQAAELVRIVQAVERDKVQQIMHICQSTVGGMEYLGMVQYTYYGVPTSIDILRGKGIIYMQFRWKPFVGIYITEAGFLDIGRPAVPVNRVSSTNSILEEMGNKEKLRAFRALQFKSYEDKGLNRATGVQIDPEEVVHSAGIMGNFYIPEIENSILEAFKRRYNETVLHCLTDRSDQLIRSIKEAFQTLITDLEDNMIPEEMIQSVMSYVSSEISHKTIERNQPKFIEEDEEEER